MKKLFLSVLILFSVLISLYSQNYTKSDIIIYISKYKNSAIKKMNEYKIPASITLAQGDFRIGCWNERISNECK